MKFASCFCIALLGDTKGCFSFCCVAENKYLCSILNGAVALAFLQFHNNFTSRNLSVSHFLCHEKAKDLGLDFTVLDYPQKCVEQLQKCQDHVNNELIAQLLRYLFFIP